VTLVSLGGHQLRIGSLCSPEEIVVFLELGCAIIVLGVVMMGFECQFGSVVTAMTLE
jgi:hypothetical protein